MRSRSALAPALILAATILPRLVVLVHERGAILTAFTEKSDNFARTFVASGTFGYIPGIPSANTQPLYGFFLIPIYWIFGRTWWAVGIVQIGVACLSALIVFEIGRRFFSWRAGLLAALAATLSPYLIWHDVHVNREILDTPIAGGLVLTTLLLASRPSWRAAIALGVVSGLAVLGNVRLTILPVVLLAYAVVCLGPSRRSLALAACSLAVGTVVVLPWVVRNKVEVGCFAITTDSKALWKANNSATYGILARGGWIDDVPNIPGTPPTPLMAGDHYLSTGEILPVDECAQMDYYENLVTTYWRDHPGAKLRLAAQAGEMLWDPQSTETAGQNKTSTLDVGRGVVLPLYMGILYALAIFGLLIVRRRIAVLLMLIFAYQTVAAMLFVGATRYRVSWDFCVALLAAVAADEAIRRFGRRRATAP